MRWHREVVVGLVIWSVLLILGLRSAATWGVIGSRWTPTHASSGDGPIMGAAEYERLRSPQRPDLSYITLKSYVAERIEPFRWLYTWKDLCETERKRTGLQTQAELCASALGPQKDGFAVVPRSETPCIGSGYLAFFRDSLTYRWAPHASPRNETTLRFPHWAIDTPYVSFSQLLKPASYNFTTLPTGAFCSNAIFAKQPVRVLIVTLSHPKQVHERQSLRSYLAAPPGLRRIFLVGNPVRNSDYLTRCDLDSCKLDETLFAQLRDEQEDYGDIVWADCLDTYQNLVHKTGAGFQWAYEACPEAQCIWKMDIDVYANYDKLLSHCRSVTRFKWFGMCQYNWPSRLGTRNVVTADEWPSNHFPLYTAGPAYGFSRSALGALLHTLAHIRFPPIEDVTTGVAAALAGMECTGMDRILDAARGDDSASNICKVMLSTSDSVVQQWRLCPQVVP